MLNPMMDQSSLGVYDLPAQHVHFLDSIAKQSNLNVAIDKYFSGAMNGKTVQEMDQSDDDLKAAEFAAEVARRTADQDDARYQQTLDMLGQEMKSAPTIPNMTATRPNVLGSLGAAIGMAFAPGAGGSIMEGYNQGVNRNQQQELQGKQARYEAETDAYNKRLGIAKFRAERAGLTADKSQAQLATANRDITTAKTKKADRDAKARLQQEKTDLARNSQLLKMGPAGRYQWALANGYSEEAAQFAAYLPSELAQVATAEEKNALLPGKLQAQQDEHMLKSLNAERMRAENPLRVQKLEADIQRTIASAKLSDAYRTQVIEKTRYIAPEFALRAADTYSKIAEREEQGQAPNPADLKRIRDILKADLDQMIDPKDPLASLGRMTPQDREVAKAKMDEFQRADAAYRNSAQQKVNPYAPALPGEVVPFATGPIGNKGTGTRPQTVAPKTPKVPTQKNDVQRAMSRFGQTGK